MEIKDIDNLRPVQIYDRRWKYLIRENLLAYKKAKRNKVRNEFIDRYEAELNELREVVNRTNLNNNRKTFLYNILLRNDITNMTLLRSFSDDEIMKINKVGKVLGTEIINAVKLK